MYCDQESVNYFFFLGFLKNNTKGLLSSHLYLVCTSYRPCEGMVAH